MKILVCGANGFVGRAIAERLEREGHAVVRGVRRPLNPGEMAVDYMQDLTPEQWLAKLDGIEAVVNAVGILVENSGQTFANIHTKAPIALFTACRMRGIKRIVQISALHAESRQTPYFASKCAADNFLLAEAAHAHVLRPSLIYGDKGASARMFRMTASLPLHLLPAGGRQRFRPLHIDDLAELITRIIAPDICSSRRCISCLPCCWSEPALAARFTCSSSTGLGRSRQLLRSPGWSCAPTGGLPLRQ